MLKKGPTGVNMTKLCLIRRGRVVPLFPQKLSIPSLQQNLPSLHFEYPLEFSLLSMMFFHPFLSSGVFCFFDNLQFAFYTVIWLFIFKFLSICAAPSQEEWSAFVF